MVGVTSQGSNRRSQQRSGSGRVGNESVRQEQEQECRNKIQGPIEKHTPKHRLQVWPSLKYTSVISFMCLADCRVESLIAESTRWPALVLQPTRQVSPTIIGKSIPDTWREG
ncbi:unnamed protein product [Staurois parvus]|uniref:Uncharacterized protein n=1 Tax=Staurois parvus TaxID=386267 RepID=A0ABN9HMB3_9NEOB|nr:unnamed protein product [Staurois parvus]